MKGEIASNHITLRGSLAKEDALKSELSLNELTLVCDMVHSVNLCSFLVLKIMMITSFRHDPTYSPKELKITPRGIVKYL